MSLNTIMVPTDLSDDSNRALTWGVHLAEHLDARLIALHVCEELSAFLAAQLEQHGEGRVAYEEKVLVERRAELRDALHAVPGHDRIATDVLLRAGYPPVEIADVAREEDAGLLVLTTHGRTGFSHAIMGSVAEKIMRTTRTPVLALKGAGPHEAPRIRRVLYAADLTDESFGGFWFAQRVASAFKAELHLVHVIDDSDGSPMVSWHHLPMISPDTFAAHVQQAADQELRGHLDVHNPDRYPVEIHHRRGIVHQEILELAGEIEADLVVLTTHGRSGLPHLVLGSVAEKVVRLAPMPVAALPRKRIDT